MTMRMLLIIVLVLFYSTMCLRGQMYPHATTLPGMYWFVDDLRLSPDGRYVTLVGSYSTIVIDQTADTCVLSIEMHNPLQNYSSILAGVCSVSPNGSELVHADTAGVIRWYHVGESVPWRIDRVGKDRYIGAKLLSDSVLALSFDEAATGLLLTSGGRAHTIPIAYLDIDHRSVAASQTADWWATIGQWSVVLQSIDRPTWTIKCDTVVLKVFVQDDSLLIITLPTYNQIVNIRTRQEVARMVHGDVLGLAPDKSIVVAQDTLTMRVDPHSYRVRDTLQDVRYAEALIRSRFIVTYDKIVDLASDTVLVQLRNYENNSLVDVLPSLLGCRYTNYRSSSQGTISWIGQGVTRPPTRVFGGPIVTCVQDPRDSTIYLMTSVRENNMEDGHYGEIYRLKHGVWHCYSVPWTYGNPLQYSGGFLPFRKVQGEWCSAYSLSYYQGLVRFGDTVTVLKRHERRRSTVPSDFDDVEGYDFAEDGTVLRRTRTLVTVGQCSVATTYYADRSATPRFVPKTTYFMVDSVRHDYTRCSDSLTISRVRVSPYQPYGLAVDTTGRCTLLDLREAYRPLATATVQNVRDVTWADSGATVRLLSPDFRLTSLSSNGTVLDIQLPRIIKDTRVSSFWSHNGRVLTLVWRDTLVSIDVVTTKVLRQWIGAPYLLGQVVPYPAVVVVSDVDAHVIVSSQNGIVSVFDGVELDVTTSTPERAEEPAILYTDDQSICGALPNSCVNVYDLLGNLVAQVTTDGAGRVPTTLRQRPLGAYFAMYSSANGPKVVRIQYELRNGQ